MLFTCCISVLLVTFLDELGRSGAHITEYAILDGVSEELGKDLLVTTSLHQIQLVVAVGVEPEDVTARLKQHKVELMREACLCNSQNHGLLADLFVLFRRHPIIASLLLAQVESLN